jgi:hypothetical protein
VVKAALSMETCAMLENRPLLCGHCHVGIEGRINPDGNGVAVCPKCGQMDTLENAMREAGEFAAHFYAKQLQKTIRDSVRSSDAFKVIEHELPERNFRFVTQLE